MKLPAKDVVLRAIERRDPSRLPINYYNRDFDCSDTITTGPAKASGFVPDSPGRDEWGYIWKTLDGTMGQPQAPPLADVTRLAGYTPPDPTAPGRFEHFSEVIDTYPCRFLRVGTGITGFNQAIFLRGFEEFLIDLYSDRAMAKRILDLVFNYENAMIDQFCQFPFDAVVFADDWGTQQGLLISPNVWREVFRPRYAEQFARIHKAGKKVCFHSCGNIAEIIGDLIDIGVDVIELLQPDIFGIEWLGQEFGGQVCFCCSVDHQRRAISGTRDEIFAYVEKLVYTLGAFHGGFIGYIEDYRSLGMSEETYQNIREAFHTIAYPVVTDTTVSNNRRKYIQDRTPFYPG